MVLDLKSGFRGALGVVLAVFLFLAAAMPAAAGTDEVFNRNGLAVRGTDVVAYFTEGRPVKGKAAFEHEWKGVRWRFASAAHRDAFAADPEKYAPQFGGYCAWAVASGYTASTVPEAWKVVEGKLYLNYSLGVRERWEQDIPGNIAKAEGNWPAVLKK